MFGVALKCHAGRIFRVLSQAQDCPANAMLRAMSLRRYLDAETSDLNRHFF